MLSNSTLVTHTNHNDNNNNNNDNDSSNADLDPKCHWQQHDPSKLLRSRSPNPCFSFMHLFLRFFRLTQFSVPCSTADSKLFV